MSTLRERLLGLLLLRSQPSGRTQVWQLPKGEWDEDDDEDRSPMGPASSRGRIGRAAGGTSAPKTFREDSVRPPE